LGDRAAPLAACYVFELLIAHLPWKQASPWPGKRPLQAPGLRFPGENASVSRWFSNS